MHFKLNFTSKMAIFNKFSLIFAIFFVFSAFVSAEEKKIKLLEVSESRSVNPNQIENAQDCGTPGETGAVLEVHATGCVRSPCSMQPNVDYESAILFRAGQTSSNLKLVITAINGANEQPILESMIEGSIVDGGMYVIPDMKYRLDASLLHANIMVKFELTDDSSGYIQFCANFRANILEAKVTHTVYMDFTIGSNDVGRVYIGMFGDVVPLTVENFVTICETGIDGMSYTGNNFHRTIPAFMIQGGDIVNGDGSGQISIYGPSFPDENFILRHLSPGYLSMANSGPNTNGCQFFITTVVTSWLDGVHVVFGKVIDGMDHVRSIESNPTDGSNRPILRAGIKSCGVIKHTA